MRVVAAVLATPRRRRVARARADTHRRELPVVVDLLAVAVGAGCTPFGAVEVAAQWCPPGAAASLRSVLRACRLGVSFDDALRETARDAPELRAVADALSASARLGAPITPTLARLSAEARADLRRAAEQRARTVPVRLLFPLVFLVLPAFTLLTVAPVVLDGFTT
jgi:tight adherence protein C